MLFAFAENLSTLKKALRERTHKTKETGLCVIRISNSRFALSPKRDDACGLEYDDVYPVCRDATKEWIDGFKSEISYSAGFGSFGRDPVHVERSFNRVE